MTDDPYRRNGDASLSRIAGKPDGAKDRLADGFNKAKTGALDAFERVVDAVEGQIRRAPADIQPAARKAVSVARERPMATMVGLAAIALLLSRGARRR